VSVVQQVATCKNRSTLITHQRCRPLYGEAWGDESLLRPFL